MLCTPRSTVDNKRDRDREREKERDVERYRETTDKALYREG